MKKIIAALGAVLIFAGLKAQDTNRVKKTTTPQVKSNKTVSPARTNADAKTAFPKKSNTLKTAFPKNTDTGQIAFPKHADSGAIKNMKHTPVIKN
jgi:hypothetical protein